MISTLYEKFQHWSATGSVYIMSDPHFGDSDCKLMDKDWITPEEQVKRINTLVHKADTLILLGDIGDVSYVKQLKAGYKVLIMGNHDQGATIFKRQITKYRLPIHEDVDTRDDIALAQEERRIRQAAREQTADFVSGHIEFSFHNPFVYYLATVDNHLFDEVYEGPLFIAEKILLSHEPILGLDFCLNIHGHDHAGTKIPQHLNLAANVCGYKPVSLADIIKRGGIAKIQTIHRDTIDHAIKRKAKRKGAKR